ncbi:hypothetical protein Zmor_006269 [Zophobas morio]|uniref:Craniofacial development protein 2 n=1 Tax=Zophobas morio TaxID=2755281 RepID=A0AA38IUN1_9CUCU|nr:hypothetical protein Zmor_006269 [Zophobas morio]
MVTTRTREKVKGKGRETKKRRVQVKIKERGLYVGTWNLRGIYEEGAVENLVNQVNMCKLDILALQETKLKSSEVNQIGNYILFCSGSDNRRLGTGFVKFKAVSDRICMLRMKEEDFT